jgi:hypothetical protein
MPAENAAEMDAAAANAKIELDHCFDHWTSANDVARWWKKFLPIAGHKRLGRLLVEKYDPAIQPTYP